MTCPAPRAKILIPACHEAAVVGAMPAGLIRVRRCVMLGTHRLARMGGLPQRDACGGQGASTLRQMLTRPCLRAGLEAAGPRSALRWERDDRSRVAPTLKPGIAR